MKIAILYIGTGSYSVFWNEFYKSSETFFLPNLQKHYFVFSDCISEINENVTLIYKQCEGFPNDSLFRFDMFLNIKNQLSSFDYIYFFNSNMLFLDFVGSEILPLNNSIDNGLLAVLHPGHYNRSLFYYPYERNIESLAFIPFQKHKRFKYFMGGVNGGIASNYLKLIEECSTKINLDYRNGIIAKYHDESHLNKYLHNINCKILGPEYGWIEGKESSVDIKILIRDKTKISLKFEKQSKKLFGRIYNLVVNLFEFLIWKYFRSS